MSEKHIAESSKKDTISRQAAIDALHMHLMYRMGTDSNKKRLDDWINNLPSAQPEPHWIPCSERMPDEDCLTGANVQYSVPVLMTAYNADDEETIVDYGHTVDGRWYSDTKALLVPSWWEVLAWMPLPEPYKERRTDE